MTSSCYSILMSNAATWLAMPFWDLKGLDCQLFSWWRWPSWVSSDCAGVPHSDQLLVTTCSNITKSLWSWILFMTENVVLTVVSVLDSTSLSWVYILMLVSLGNVLWCTGSTELIIDSTKHNHKLSQWLNFKQLFTSVCYISLATGTSRMCMSWWNSTIIIWMRC